MSYEDGHCARLLVLLLGGLETVHSSQHASSISGGDSSKHSLPRSVFRDAATLTQKGVEASFAESVSQLVKDYLGMSVS